MIGTPKKLVEFLWNQPKDKIFEIKEKKNARSLNANAYAWQLITDIGNFIHESKERVYERMLEEYGQSQIITALEKIDLSGYCKYYRPLKRVRLNGKWFVHYKVMKGSSEFDKEEMSIFIDGLVTECENMGIPTLDDIQRERLLEAWDVSQEKKGKKNGRK